MIRKVLNKYTYFFDFFFPLSISLLTMAKTVVEIPMVVPIKKAKDVEGEELFSE